MSARSRIEIVDYRVFFDRQVDGWGTIGGSLVRGDDDELIGVYHCGPFEDDDAGQHPFLIRSKDEGRTWTEPVPFGPPIQGERSRQSVGLSLFGPTQGGTYLTHGCHMQLAEKDEDRFGDLNFRAYTLLVGRRPVTAGTTGAFHFDFERYAPGTFLGEQFLERGVQLASGRLVFAIWGCMARGENWRCGVLLSDDDGLSWRYRDVGYEPDLAIRDRPEGVGYPAGFNEQSLFLLPSGRLVSMIRGREKLGRVPDSERDTWFFHSASDDDGETWSPPVETNIAGTGAAGVGYVLPDGSLLHACRVPYSRTLLTLEDPALNGLHLARSFDEGQSWETQRVLQHDPEGKPFHNHYNAMNGQFVPLNRDRVLYVFGQFDVAAKVYRILALELRITS
ncbi:MAG: exo-alpha-sialidase [Gemmatimonadetes bacterium]|nr:exo-alpha-sialidase [Gemmatimonadota bacterium]MBT6143797.1 exo-alpha-sialidase [Gemmatimonadota bacterium]MBT7861048.1 exo-alpha-sialidase [Gemmatimonadota bacterium]